MNPTRQPSARRIKRASKKMSGDINETNISEMLSKVTDIIKNNPGVVSQINSCMSTLMKAPEMINKILSTPNTSS